MKTGIVDFGEFKITVKLLPDKMYEIINWENLQRDDGSQIPFSTENAAMVFDKYPRINEELGHQVSVLRRLEADVKNCPFCGVEIPDDEEPEPPADYCHHG